MSLLVSENTAEVKQKQLLMADWIMLDFAFR